MTEKTDTITWMAETHSASWTRKYGESRSIRAAVYAARDYTSRQHEWSGKVYFFTQDDDDAFRCDELGGWTKNKWITCFNYTTEG